MRARMLTSLAAAAVVLATPAASRAAVAWTPCAETSAPTMQCGTAAVPLDRSGTIGGSIPLNLRRVPATSAGGDTAVLALAGGPGQAATALAANFARNLGPALTTRDLLVMDQRGTGRSGLLWCQGLSTPSTRTDLEAASGACSRQLGARRGLYRTSDTVADIEAVRQAAGYARLTIVGVSYGTKVALEYAARYPDRVERLVLDSVVPPDGPDPLQRSTFAAIPRVLGELCAKNACAGITNDPTRGLRALVRRLGRGPLRSHYIDGHGRRHPVRITSQKVLSVLLHGDSNPALRAEFPAALGAWRRGSALPLARLVAHAGGRITLGDSPASVAPALYTATLCEELSFPWSRGAGTKERMRQARRALRDLPPTEFAPFDRATVLDSDLVEACMGWRNATAAPPAAIGKLPAVPTLVLSGGGDLRTPLEDAKSTAARLPLTPQIVVVPWVGHSVLTSELAPEGCAAHALAAFFADAVIPGCSTQKAPISLARRAPNGLASQRTVGTLNGRLGRTVGAAIDTLTDVRREVLYEKMEGETPTRVGGLRGGFATASSTGLELHRVRYVPGVEVSGSAPEGATTTLRISGGGALRGTVMVSADMQTVSGRLDGTPFSTVLAPAASG
jgi:pimeloyl-ACP methyl ester carboxylesterase